MPTFKIILETTSGLYRDLDSGRRYQGRELLEQLPSDVLTHRARLERLERCVYAIHLKANGGCTYELYSRRRRPRQPDPWPIPNQA